MKGRRNVTQLQLETATLGNETHLILRGKLTLANTREVRATLLGGVEASAGGLFVDLREIRYLDSSGVAILVEGRQAAIEAGKTFTLVEPSRAVMQVLELSQLDRIFTIRRGA